VDDAYQRSAIGALIHRHDALGWRILRKVFRIVKIRRPASRLTLTIEPWIVLARDVPLAFGELLVLDSNTYGDDRGATSLLDRTVVPRLTRRGIEIAPLHFAERGHCLPHTVGRPHVDRVLGLAEADDERRGAWVVLHDRGEIL